MTELVPVAVPCPTGQHPDGDSVSLWPTIPLAGGIEARRKIAELADGAGKDEVIGLLMEVYLRHGIAAWTLHDDDGALLNLDRQAIRDRVLSNLDLAISIANTADDLYSPAVVTPLVTAAAKSSRRSRPASSTSAPTASKRSPRKRSKPSSTSTTPMDATAAITG
jgi:hypothetical protein